MGQQALARGQKVGVLTDLKLRRLKPRDKPYEVTDGLGLYVEVMPSGARVFRYRYMLDGKREKVTLGTYPDVSLAEAQAEHAKLRLQVKKHRVSPAAVKRQGKANEAAAIAAQITVSDFVKQYVADQVLPVRKRPELVTRYLRLDVIPTIGAMRMVDVTTADLWKVIDRIRQRGAVQAAGQVRGTLKRMFAYARSRGVIGSNPAEGIRGQDVARPKSRDRSLSQDELRQFLITLYQLNMRRASKLALHLLLLTMARKGELVFARWEQVRLDVREWEIPAENSKTGVPHVVYLSRQAADIFAELHELAGASPWVIPRRGDPERPIHESTLNRAIDAVEWGIAHFTVHDLRRTASTLLHEQGWNSDVIEKALNHTIGGVRGVYNRAQYADARREMLQAWADLLDALVGASRVVIGAFRRSV